ncbi:MAG: N-acetylmuramoyl-L-alanine amidase [Pseudomonadota bacterium]
MHPHRTVPSPNYDERSGAPDMIVLHYTDMDDVEAAIKWLSNPESRVSAHYVITAQGECVDMVEEGRRAWHAGVSSWEDTTNINDRSIGIELDSPGHRPTAPEFPAAQIDTLLLLIDAIRGRWSIPRRRIVAHSDIAPMRKIDPGEAFPWKRLAEAGHALLAEALAPPKRANTALLFHELNAAGYGWPETPEEEAALVRAFHRRHRPADVDVPADGTTMALARAFRIAVEDDRRAAP